MLQAYVSDDVGAENNAALTRYSQPLAMSPTQCAEALAPRSHSRGEVYDEYV